MLYANNKGINQPVYISAQSDQHLCHSLITIHDASKFSKFNLVFDAGWFEPYLEAIAKDMIFHGEVYMMNSLI